MSNRAAEESVTVDGHRFVLALAMKGNRPHYSSDNFLFAAATPGPGPGEVSVNVGLQPHDSHVLLSMLHELGGAVRRFLEAADVDQGTAHTITGAAAVAFTAGLFGRGGEDSAG